MLRRSFLASLLGLAPAPRPPAEPAPHARRDQHGDSLAEPYVLRGGSYARCRPADLRPGDTFIMIGLDGDRLWKATRYTVGPGGHFVDHNGMDCTVIEGESVPLVGPV